MLGAMATLLAAELLLRILPVSTATETGYYISPSILTYPPHHDFKMATGWNLSNAHHHHSNNYGFLTDKDFSVNPAAVAVIGDSYVEANMLKEEDRLNFRLEKKLGNQPVYAMGGPGSSLLDYAERARFAQETFGIRNFVFVIETGDVKQTLCGSGNIHGPCLDSHTFNLRSEAQLQKAGLAKKLLRKSALAQYLFSQLRLKPENLINQLFRAPASDNAPPHKKSLSTDSLSPEAIDHVLSAYLANLAKLKMDHWLLVFDNHRKCQKSNQNADPVRDRFMQVARSSRAIVIDTLPLFCNFSQKTGLSLAISPTDQHWNKFAQELVADAVAEKMIQAER